jgi:hypothetical protein
MADGRDVLDRNVFGRPLLATYAAMRLLATAGALTVSTIL